MCVIMGEYQRHIHERPLRVSPHFGDNLNISRLFKRTQLEAFQILLGDFDDDLNLL